MKLAVLLIALSVVGCATNYVPHRQQTDQLTQEHASYVNYVRGLVSQGQIDAYNGEMLIQRNREYIDSRISVLHKKPTFGQTMLMSAQAGLDAGNAQKPGASNCVYRKDALGALRMTCY